jgi:Uma2 family endonuclease
MATPVQVLKRRFTVEEYYKMADAGIFTENDRVELLDGEIVEMTPIGSSHAAVVDRLTKLFSRLVGEAALVRVQGPIRLSEHSEPQPDLALLKPRPDFYARAHPIPKDVLLVVEVAETSVGIDRKVKIPLYAKAGISEVWLVDVDEERVAVYRKLSSRGYDEVQRLRRGRSISPQALLDLKLSVSGVLGPELSTP